MRINDKTSSNEPPGSAGEDKDEENPTLRTFDFHPEAEAELRSVIAWYDQIDPALGTRFEKAVYQGLERIAANPKAWKLWWDSPARVYQLKRFPYYIPYVVDTQRGIVLAVAHVKQKPGYWRERLWS
jgi:plasmid stabilization system protein ParE